ncbi:BsuPI-related putative proteinase inhibitor [Aquibacillus sediminis]|uniref:BsuPI-related putative proteinase inhibitor n=1 Tax=Aquibacillus sediminis TaxID=2574734 RepID=UPI0011093834|nr:BsuPI-related putative proteinase inhibitor [Aquibacillus sediminis]
MYKLVLGSLLTLTLAACGTTGAEEPGEKQAGEEQVEENTVSMENVELSTDALIEGDQAKFVLELENTNEEDVDLLMPSGKKYEIVVTNDEGEEVYRYSEGKMFTQALETVTIPADDKVAWEEEWDLHSEDELVEEGEYNVDFTVVVNEFDGEEVEDFTDETTLEVSDLNFAFKNVNLEKSDGDYVVTGEARVFEGVFLFSVDSGNENIIEETGVQVDFGAPEWSEFTIDIAEEDVPENEPVTLSLYERSMKDGSKTNMMELQLNQEPQDL